MFKLGDKFIKVRSITVRSSADEHVAIDVAVGLRLVAVAPHDLGEVFLDLAGDLAHDVDGAHEQLVEVAVAHQLRVVLLDRVLEHRPDLPLELEIGDAQSGAEVLHARTRQIIKLEQSTHKNILTAGQLRFFE